MLETYIPRQVHVRRFAILKVVICAAFIGAVLLFFGETAVAQGVVSSATPEATAAGIEIMKAGGNAVDAAVAVAFTLGVTEPAGSGIGGQTFFLVHPPGENPFVIHGTSYAPKNLPKMIKMTDLEARRATTVPSTIRVLEFAWKKYGSGKISWKQLLAPAIRAAENGYKLGHFRYRSLARYGTELSQDKQTAQIYVSANGALPEQGTVMRTPLLGKALRRIAEFGADDFYKGQIAQDIVADMKANGGWITTEDLRDFPQPRVVPALKDAYRGFDVYTLPPPTGGWVAMLALNILERAPGNSLKTHGSDSRAIWMAETLRICHSTRRTSPITDLKKYADLVTKKINMASLDAFIKKMKLPKLPSPQKSGGETTHFSLVDPQGLAVGVTASLNAYFGAHVAHPKWGFLYNDYMNEFRLNRPASPYNLKPGGMPYSSMSATILAKNGRAMMVVGSPGSKRIISAVVQVTSQWVDVASNITNAVAAPRLHVLPEEDTLFVEGRKSPMSQELLLKLELRGYNIVRPLTSLYKNNLNPFFGGIHAVAFENGTWTGAADPRRDGTVGTTGKK